VLQRAEFRLVNGRVHLVSLPVVATGMSMQRSLGSEAARQ
jgi:hypothetical protein